MQKTCLKCGAKSNVEPSSFAACSACGAIFAKVEAALAKASSAAPMKTATAMRAPVKVWLLSMAFIMTCSAIFVVWLRSDAAAAHFQKQAQEATTPKREAKQLEPAAPSEPDPRDIFPVGKVFGNSELQKLVDTTYPQASWHPDQSFRVSFSATTYAVRTRKVDDGKVPPDYRIESVEVYTPSAPAQLPSCGVFIDEAARQGYGLMDQLSLASKAADKGLCVVR